MNSPPKYQSEALTLLAELIFLLRQRPLWNSIVNSSGELSALVQRAKSLLDDADRQAEGGAS